MLAKEQLLRERMHKKLLMQSTWSYIPFFLPRNMTKEMLIKNMKHFIDTKLKDTLQSYTHVLASFTSKDCDSIGTHTLTDNARKMIELTDFLDKYGFPGPDTFSKPMSFYSGYQAQVKACTNSNELSFSQGTVPCFTALYDLWYASQERPNTSLMFCTISKLFAYYAKGVVNVYLSSDEKNKSSGLVVGSYFWDMELPVLQHSYTTNLENRVSDIMIHQFDNKENKWHDPLSLFSHEIMSIPIYIKEMKERYQPNEIITQKQDNQKPITLGLIKKITTLWAHKTLSSSNERKDSVIIHSNNLN